MTGSSLPALGELRQIAAILLQRLIGRFRVLRGHALAAANFFQRRQQTFASDAELLQEPSRRAAVSSVSGEQEMLDGNVVVLEFLRFVPRLRR